MPLLVSVSSPHSSNKENGAICIRHQTTSKPTCCLPSMLSILHTVAFFFFSVALHTHWLSVCRQQTIASCLCNKESNPQVTTASGLSAHALHQYAFSGICKTDGNMLWCYPALFCLCRSIKPNPSPFWKSCTVFSRTSSLMSLNEVRWKPGVSHTNTKG